MQVTMKNLRKIKTGDTLAWLNDNETEYIFNIKILYVYKDRALVYNSLETIIWHYHTYNECKFKIR